MKARILVGSFVFVAAAASLVWIRMTRVSAAADGDTEAFPAWATNDSVLVLAPHPDDETIACGGTIQSALSNGVPVHVAFLTYGDNNEWSFMVYRKHPVVVPGAVERMGVVRHDEAVAATAALGLASNNLAFLGYPDFGMLHMWVDHWGDRPPFRAMLTHATHVPYASAVRPGAPHRGQDVLADLRSLIRGVRPTRVLVSSQSDHNPDHAALFLFTQVALWDLEKELRPQVYQYLVHYPGWPRPASTHASEAMKPPAAMRKGSAWCSLPVAPAQLLVKRGAIRKHKTQYGYSGKYLDSFMRATELFSRSGAPRVDGSPVGALTNALADSDGDGIAEELTTEEKAKFVGVEARTAAVEDGAFVLSITTSRPLAGTVKVSAYAFGYRPDKPFEPMPKIHLMVGPIGHSVEDQGAKLPESGCVVQRDARHITFRVPLKTLGAPDRILFSARTCVGDIPLDWGGWHILDLR